LLPAEKTGAGKRLGVAKGRFVVPQSIDTRRRSRDAVFRWRGTMNVLLDTHIALWAITDDDRLSARAREMILSERTTVWVSAVSVWEIAIKHSLGRGDMPVSGQEALGYFREAGYRFLPVEPEHAPLWRLCLGIIKTRSTACWWRRP
jgi:Uncharacterized protein conserved in bacteria